MYQGFPGDYDSGSRCSSSPSAESQYLSSVDSFGSPAAAAAAQECSGLGDMPGSFVPTVTAITTSQDLQWLVQPTLISSVAQSQPLGAPMAHPPPVDPYDLPGPSYSTPGMGAFATGPAAPSVRPTRARPRHSCEETLTPEEEEKRRVRRERNKLAAAKCRNRRRELTDRLQAPISPHPTAASGNRPVGGGESRAGVRDCRAAEGEGTAGVRLGGPCPCLQAPL
ncbi:protein FosB isoform X3 [Harpia harpyja]|uniref:protein FosB isoform X3 n=1 Tax=Harpia harpyja TaxID=202280 RepID=UPI0022B16346|nr:protein FosB isoform X3 [Harpia harpyja]XP_052635325.1 protein FosB isoform X3 [Harpia harpyja]